MSNIYKRIELSKKELELSKTKLELSKTEIHNDLLESCQNIY